MKTSEPTKDHHLPHLTRKLAKVRNEGKMLPWGAMATAEFAYNLANISPDRDGNLLTLEQAKLYYNYCIIILILKMLFFLYSRFLDWGHTHAGYFATAVIFFLK
jgi:hypothetical protein